MSVSIQNFCSGDKDPLSQDEYRQQQSQNGRRDAEVSNGVGSAGGQSTDDSGADPHHQTQPQANGGGGGAASYTERRETQGYFCAMRFKFNVVCQILTELTSGQLSFMKNTTTIQPFFWTARKKLKDEKTQNSRKNSRFWQIFNFCLFKPPKN